MSEGYNEAINKYFTQLDYKNFHVQYATRKLFVCGGLVQASTTFVSFRNQFCDHTANNFPDIHNSTILAEEFKDYSIDNIYNDLMSFQDDIASLSTLIIIFLESPGSFVELGLYTSRKEYFDKLVLVVPKKEIELGESFIFLGPIKYIKSKAVNAIFAYDFPEKNSVVDNCLICDLEDFCCEVETKIDKSIGSEQFDLSKTDHVSLLIVEIINLAYPILISEIEMCFNRMKISITIKDIRRSLFLLEKMEFIGREEYSSNTYYYPINGDKKFIKFGRLKNDETLDSTRLFMSLRQSFVLKNDPKSRKRKRVLTLIDEKLNRKNDEST